MGGKDWIVASAHITPFTVVITPLTQYLIDLYGWQWALRITGCVPLQDRPSPPLTFLTPQRMTAWAVISICAFFLIPRFPPMKVKAKLFDASFFKDYKFAMLYMAFFTSQWGFFVPWTYIPSFAVNAGMTPSQGSLALGLANGASAVGRIVLGGLADRTGHVNSYCVCMLMTPICLLLIWPFAGSSFGLLTLFGILYGFLSGYVTRSFAQDLHHSDTPNQRIHLPFPQCRRRSVRNAEPRQPHGRGLHLHPPRQSRRVPARGRDPADNRRGPARWVDAVQLPPCDSVFGVHAAGGRDTGVGAEDAGDQLEAFEEDLRLGGWQPCSRKGGVFCPTSKLSHYLRIVPWWERWAVWDINNDGRWKGHPSLA